jgi:hypothetical protein
LQNRAAVNAVEDARDKVTGLKVDLFVARGRGHAGAGELII